MEVVEVVVGGEQQRYNARLSRHRPRGVAMLSQLVENRKFTENQEFLGHFLEQLTFLGVFIGTLEASCYKTYVESEAVIHGASVWQIIPYRNTT